MIPFSLSWDTRKRSIRLRWNGLFSLGWEKGEVSTRILSIPIPISFGFLQEKPHLFTRWVYLKNAFFFLTKWKIKRVEGTFSFPDPMVNGVLYGWTSAIGAARSDRRMNVTINFLGENYCSGEALVSPKTLFSHLRTWVLPFLWKRRGRSRKRR